MASNTNQNNNAAPNFLPGFAGIPRIWGESEKDYQARLLIAQRPYQQANAERNQIRELAKTQEGMSRKTLDEQKAVQKARLNDLAALLAEQNNRTFNRNIPGIANTAQSQGFLETSGFGNALARNYTDLAQDTTDKLMLQGLTDRDLEISTLGNIGNNTNALGNSALQRQFSVTDNARAEELARELGRLGVPAPAKGPSTTDKLITSSGPILSGVGAIKGATAKGAQGSSAADIWSSF